MPKRKTADKQFKELCNAIDLYRKKFPICFGIKAFRISVKASFADFPDPRDKNRINYPAWYLILITLCAYFSDCDNVSEVAHFAELRIDWLNELVGEEYLAPSYDTF